MVYIKTMILDFNAELQTKTVTAKQQDTDSRFLLITPTTDGKRIDMTGITAVFCAEKPDGKSIINYCPIDSNGDILVELTSQTLALNGIIRCEIKLYQDMSVLSSCPFCIKVVRSVSDSGIESRDEYTILTELISKCRDILQKAHMDIEESYSSVFNAATIETYVKNYEEVTTE